MDATRFAAVLSCFLLLAPLVGVAEDDNGTAAAKLVQIAKSLRSEERHEEADKFLRDAVAITEGKLERKPDDAQARFALAQFQVELGQREAASGNLKRAIKLQPKCAAMHTFQGYVLAAAKEYEAAEAALRKALELEPGHVETRNCLVICLFNLNRKVGAVEVARETTRLAPDDASAVRVLEMILFATNNHEEWEQLLQSAIDRNPDDTEIRAYFAHMLNLLQRPSEAYAQHVKIAKLRPDDVGNEIMLVFFATVAKMSRESEQHVERVYNFHKTGKLSKTWFPRDTFFMASKKVFVAEYFEPTGKAGYKYVFSVRDKDDKEEYRIVLSTWEQLNKHFRSEGKLKEGEVVFSLDSNRGGEQEHYGIYQTLPTYEQTRALVIEIIEGTRLPNAPDAEAETTPSTVR